RCSLGRAINNMLLALSSFFSGPSLHKRAIGTKWVYRNKRDQRGNVVKNKARLVAQGLRQEKGIDYDEVFALVARIKEISQPLGFVDLEFPDRVYKVEKALYGLHQAPRVWLISWQCKKQTIMANSTTKAKYIAASNCCGQVLWLQNQLLDYGYNFMQTKIHVDNESAICVVKNLFYHSKTKDIEIRHHFIRDSYEKRLIKMVKIRTDDNVVDLLTKSFDVTRF
nr:putative ribonuclease H-like domain-containing protein [Tanacetum cinerariifolium]